jgi:hypothetical protein
MPQLTIPRSYPTLTRLKDGERSAAVSLAAVNVLTFVKSESGSRLVLNRIHRDAGAYRGYPLNTAPTESQEFPMAPATSCRPSIFKKITRGKVNKAKS